MSFYYYIIFVAMLTLIIVLIRAFFLYRKSIPVELFNEALRNENSGYFEKAIVSYETALKEAKKVKFQGRFKTKIINKLKVLHTLIDYNNSFHFDHGDTGMIRNFNQSV